MDALAPIWNLIIYDPMLNSLLFLYGIVQNYGVAIILFTIIIGLLTMPLRIKSQAAMKVQQAKQAKLQPRLEELKKKHKNDQQAYQQAQMKLMQEEGLVNPLNSGCLLMLIPFPIFIGLYGVITAVMGTTPESLLQLSQHIYSFLPSAGQLIPVKSDFFGLNLAAIPSSAYGLLSPITILIVLLVVGSSWIQQKIMTPATAAVDSQQAAMNSQMQLITPIIFGFFVVNAPVGLSLYWITFGLMTIVQQVITGGTDSLKNLVPSFGGPAKAPPKKIKPRIQSVEPDEPIVKSVPSTVSKSKKPVSKKVGRLTMIDTEDNSDESGGEESRADNGDTSESKPGLPPGSLLTGGGPKKGKKKRGNKY